MPSLKFKNQQLTFSSPTRQKSSFTLDANEKFLNNNATIVLSGIKPYWDNDHHLYNLKIRILDIKFVSDTEVEYYVDFDLEDTSGYAGQCVVDVVLVAEIETTTSAVA